MGALCRATRGATSPHSLEIMALGTIISLISFHINADLMPDNICAVPLMAF